MPLARISAVLGPDEGHYGACLASACAAKLDLPHAVATEAKAAVADDDAKSEAPVPGALSWL